MSIRRDITEHFREGIMTGLYPAGSPLPSSQEIARTFGTQPANVQRALRLLVQEGLIVREPRVGTRVREKAGTLTSLAVYLKGMGGAQLLPYRRYYWGELEKRLARKGISIRVVTEDAAGNGLRALRRLAQSDRAQAALFLELSPEEITELKKLPIPILGLSSTQLAPRVGIDYRSLLALALPELKKYRCERLGMISTQGVLHTLQIDAESMTRGPATSFLHDGILFDARAMLEDSAIPENEHSYALLGYSAFKRLMELPDRPDSLLVYPDKFLPGVLAAAYELKVDLNKTFKCIFAHRNRELPELFPAHVLYLEISLDEMVDATLVLLNNVYTHTGPQNFSIRHRLVNATLSKEDSL